MPRQCTLVSSSSLLKSALECNLMGGGSKKEKKKDFKSKSSKATLTELDEEVIRDIIEESGAEHWGKILEDVLTGIQQEMSSCPNPSSLIRSDFHRFAHLALTACVETESAECLKITLDWVGRANENGAVVPTTAIKVDAECMVRAANSKKNFQLVHMLYDDGFELTCPLVGHGGMYDYDRGREFEAEDDVLMQLGRLQALCSPEYLLARHRTFPRDDPVAEAFRMLGKVCGKK